jgi:hypothetical protein
MPALAYRPRFEPAPKPRPRLRPRPAPSVQPRLEPRPQPRLKTFHARLLVTRAEEWPVEAETAEQAQELLASGHGHRAALGECVHVELEGMLDEAG